MWRRLAWALAWAVLVAAGAWAEEEEVPGKGHASTRVPADTTDPPDDYTSDQAAHDPEAGVVFGSTEDYGLLQGADLEDKKAWSRTDHIHWQVSGATLEAQGKVQDSDPAAATIATSEAWGHEIIDVEVSASEGAYAVIRAENRILFAYDYVISGPSIGEASVQLLGAAHDLDGKTHPFALSAQAGENVTEEAEQRSALRIQGAAKSSGSFGLSGSGVQAGVSGEKSFEVETEETEGVRITRRIAQAGGDAGATDPVHKAHRVSGSTPLRKTYDVFSDGSVLLRARSAAKDSKAVVVLNLYKVENALRAWKEAFQEELPPDEDPPPPPSAPGDGGTGPTTPGGGSGGGEPDDEEGGVRGCPPGVDAPWTPWRDTCIWCCHVPPRGLAGERGSLDGVLSVRIGDPQDAALVLDVAVEPAGALDVPSPIVVEAGRSFGAVRFQALEAGPATVVLRVLDEAGAATSASMTVPVGAPSLADFEETEIWATVGGKAWRPGAGVAVHACAGDDAGPLRIGRVGYAHYMGEATSVTLAVDDPQGILPALPAAVEIPAGEASVALPLQLGVAAGRAVITATSAGREVRVTVVAQPRSWRSVARIRVPVNAEAAVPFLVERPERAVRLVEAASAAPEVAAVEPEARLLPGEPAWYVAVRGAARGRALIRLATNGLPALEVPVDVVAEDVAVSGGRLEIRGLDGSRGGTLCLVAPEGVRFAGLELPATAPDYLDVTGLGTGSLVLEFLPSPDLAEEISLPITLEGTWEGALCIDVHDALHGSEEEGIPNSYRILVR